MMIFEDSYHGITFSYKEYENGEHNEKSWAEILKIDLTMSALRERIRCGEIIKNIQPA